VSTVLIALLQLVSLVLVARALMSWVPARRGSGFESVKLFVDRLTDPIVDPVRRILPSMGGLDISVLVVLLVINFLLIPVAASF
jgi:YggT family protein